MDFGPELSELLSSTFLKFALVGALTFFVDAGMLLAFKSVISDIYVSRCLSFLCALTFSWVLNRHFTFSADARGWGIFREWMRFAASNATGGAVNIGVSLLLVTVSALIARYPILAVAAGSAAGLAFNYTATRLFVFPVRNGAASQDPPGEEPRS